LLLWAAIATLSTITPSRYSARLDNLWTIWTIFGQYGQSLGATDQGKA